MRYQLALVGLLALCAASSVQAGLYSDKDAVVSIKGDEFEARMIHHISI